MQFHVAQGGEAVEPGVGDGFHDLAEAFPLDAGFQPLALGGDLLRVGPAADEGNFAADLDGLAVPFAPGPAGGRGR